MSAAPPVTHTRRVPQQTRSRDRVERILDTAAGQVVGSGVDMLSTRTIARAAGIPVASLYQYFADKDAILLALVERDLDAADRAVTTALTGAEGRDLGAAVEAAVGALAATYRERPAFVMIWLRGRTNPQVRDFRREHHRRAAEVLLTAARDRGLVGEEMSPCHAEIAVEVADRLLQLAFESDLSGDDIVIGEATKVVVGYLSRFTPAP